jgi:hypothetical protein
VNDVVHPKQAELLNFSLWNTMSLCTAMYNSSAGQVLLMISHIIGEQLTQPRATCLFELKSALWDFLIWYSEISKYSDFNICKSLFVPCCSPVLCTSDRSPFTLLPSPTCFPQSLANHHVYWTLASSILLLLLIIIAGSEGIRICFQRSTWTYSLISYWASRWCPWHPHNSV